MLTNPTYQQAKDAIFATATIPDGYNGKTADVGFALAVLDWAPVDWLDSLKRNGEVSQALAERATLS